MSKYRLFQCTLLETDKKTPKKLGVGKNKIQSFEMTEDELSLETLNQLEDLTTVDASKIIVVEGGFQKFELSEYQEKPAINQTATENILDLDEKQKPPDIIVVPLKRK